jgi:hypothetical protein
LFYFEDKKEFMKDEVDFQELSFAFFPFVNLFLLLIIDNLNQRHQTSMFFVKAKVWIVSLKLYLYLKIISYLHLAKPDILLLFEFKKKENYSIWLEFSHLDCFIN